MTDEQALETVPKELKLMDDGRVVVGNDVVYLSQCEKKNWWALRIQKLEMLLQEAQAGVALEHERKIHPAGLLIHKRRIASLPQRNPHVGGLGLPHVLQYGAMSPRCSLLKNE